MTGPNLIADELGAIRDLIRTLRGREQELRRRILTRRPNAPLEGAEWIVTVRSGTTRRFDSHALPEGIRSNPAYWKETPTQTVLAKRAPVSGAARKDRDADIVLVEPAS